MRPSDVRLSVEGDNVDLLTGLNVNVDLKRCPVESSAWRTFCGQVLAVARDDAKLPHGLLDGDDSLSSDVPVAGGALHPHREHPWLAVFVHNTTVHSGREQKNEYMNHILY